MKSGKFLKNALIWGNCKNLVKMWKVEKFRKSLKSGKFGTILKNIFYRVKMKSGKFLKNMLEFVETGKIWKSVKNRKIL